VLNSPWVEQTSGRNTTIQYTLTGNPKRGEMAVTALWGRKLLSGTVVHVNDALAYVRLHATGLTMQTEKEYSVYSKVGCSVGGQLAMDSTWPGLLHMLD